MIAIDTNLLVYAHRSSLREHRAAKEAIETALNDGGCGIASAAIAEFWAVVTHRASERPSRPDEAHDFLRALVEEGGMEIWPMTRDAAARLPRMARDLGVRGNRIFDLQIALTALDAGASEVWTHDRNFVAVPGLGVRDPLG